MQIKKAEKGDVRRLALVGFVATISCLWILVCHDWEFRSSLVYLMMLFAAFGGYVVVKVLGENEKRCTKMLR